MPGWTILALVVVGLAIVGVTVALWRQGFPPTGRSREDSVSDEGPTTASYPPGSRPAGPGAESMSRPSSESMSDEGTENDDP